MILSPNIVVETKQIDPWEVLRLAHIRRSVNAGDGYSWCAFVAISHFEALGGHGCLFLSLLCPAWLLKGSVRKYEIHLPKR